MGVHRVIARLVQADPFGEVNYRIRDRGLCDHFDVSVDIKECIRVCAKERLYGRGVKRLNAGRKSGGLSGRGRENQV